MAVLEEARGLPPPLQAPQGHVHVRHAFPDAGLEEDQEIVVFANDPLLSRLPEEEELRVI